MNHHSTLLNRHFGWWQLPKPQCFGARTVQCNSGPLAAGCCGNCAAAQDWELIWIVFDGDFMGMRYNGIEWELYDDSIGFNGDLLRLMVISWDSNEIYWESSGHLYR